MSWYTTELRYICENAAGFNESQDRPKINEIIEAARPKIFDFDYPIFDEEYRPVLETKILRHYYMREICSETVASWKFYLENMMNEIMPYYNQLYKSELIKFDPMHDHDYTTTKEQTNEGQISETGDLKGNVTAWGTSDQQTDEHKSSTEGKTDNTTENRTIDKTGNSATDDHSLVAGTVNQDNTHETTETNKNTGTEKATRDITNKDTQNVNQKTVRDDDATTQETHSDTSHTDGTVNENSSSLDLYADTPQGGIQGLLGRDKEGHSQDYKYLTNARQITGSDDTTSSEDNRTNGTHNTTYTDDTTTTLTGDTTKDTTGKVIDDKNTTNNTEISKTLTDANKQTSSEDTQRNIGVDTTENTEENGTTKFTSQGEYDGQTNIGSKRQTHDNTDTTQSTKNEKASKSTEEYVIHVAGKSIGKSYSKMLQEFRETFLNIDMEIINRLSVLFFGLW